MLISGSKRLISSLKSVLEEKVALKRETLSKAKKDYGHFPLDQMTADQLIGGMRSVKALLTETSKLDPFHGIRFRGLSIPECFERLPAKYREPLPEAMFWLLLTGEVPSSSQLEELRSEMAAKASIPEHTKNLIRSFPKETHPMTQFSAGVLSLGIQSKFDKAYFGGAKRTEYWESTLEDSINLVAKLPHLAAFIYRNAYKNGKTRDPQTELDFSENFGKMLGWDDVNFFEFLRLYIVLHCDHEGGNVSAHATHLVGSALCDAYKSFSAGLNGLAGPLHGLANQECLTWLLKLRKVVGDDPSEETIEVYVKQTLSQGQVIPGYGHAVLRVTDPRFTAFQNFSKKVMWDCPLCRIVEKCSKVVPKVLKESGKVKNPFPNIDAHSGSLLYYFGLVEHNFFTVLFGVSRAMGVTASLVWDRALMLPIERPGSITLLELEEFN